MRDDVLRTTAGAGFIASVIVFIATGGAPLVRQVVTAEREAQAAAAFFVQSITAAKIVSDYHGAQFGDSLTTASPSPAAQNVRILIVPGHQPSAGGTSFGDLYERDIVVDIADALAKLLGENPHYDAMVARTKTAWNPILQTYFDAHRLEIETFRESQARQMADYLANGSILPEADQVYHNTAPSEAAFKLYGINKWASDNAYDIILHLHLNDYAGRRTRSAGIYDGFAVYVPDRQYSNASASTLVGEAIASRLAAYHATSTLPKEDRGVVEDQQLIAIGSNNSVNGAALLIEYGYIFEPQFTTASVRPLAVADYAYQTYLGLQDFFRDPPRATSGSEAFPYDWTTVEGKMHERGPGVYALQAALRYLGFYPPAGRSFSACPLSGEVGSCTRAALMAYQRARGLRATGTLGPLTREALREDTEPSVDLAGAR